MKVFKGERGVAFVEFAAVVVIFVGAIVWFYGSPQVRDHLSQDPKREENLSAALASVYDRGITIFQYLADGKLAEISNANSVTSLTQLAQNLKRRVGDNEVCVTVSIDGGTTITENVCTSGVPANQFPCNVTDNESRPVVCVFYLDNPQFNTFSLLNVSQTAIAQIGVVPASVAPGAPLIPGVVPPAINICTGADCDSDTINGGNTGGDDKTGGGGETGVIAVPIGGGDPGSTTIPGGEVPGGEVNSGGPGGTTTGGEPGGTVGGSETGTGGETTGGDIGAGTIIPPPDNSGTLTPGETGSGTTFPAGPIGGEGGNVLPDTGSGGVIYDPDTGVTGDPINPSIDIGAQYEANYGGEHH